MDQSAAQRLAHAEAVARRWKRRVESLALSDACDELFCLVVRNSLAAERAVERLRASVAGATEDRPDRGAGRS